MGRPKEKIDPKIGARIKAIRNNLKTPAGKRVTREVFAEHFDVSVTAVSYWENGRRKVPERVIQELSETLNIDKNFILGKYDDPMLSRKLSEWDAEISSRDIQSEIMFVEYLEYRLNCKFSLFDQTELADFLKEIDEFIIFKYNKLKGQ